MTGTATQETLTDRLVRHEGLRLRPYRDTAGKLTIGVGRNLDDVGLSHGEAMALLANDIAAAKAALDRTQPWWRALDAVRADVLTELAFNLGAAKLAGFTTALAHLKAGRFAAAADALAASLWARQVGRRAEELCTLIRTGG